jgi:hypothetical protein
LFTSTAVLSYHETKQTMKKLLCGCIALITLGVTNGFVFAAETAATTVVPAPKIKFETNFFDFGKMTSAEKLSGSFKFKNIGNAVLKLDSPQASCDCTEAKIKPDTLAPGESGEVTYSIKIDHAVSGQRYIKVHSNDPENPDLELTIQLDYTPLFETTPPHLDVLLRPGKDEVQTSFIVNRMDEKALGIDRLATSQEWITAEFDATYDPPGGASVFGDAKGKAPESSARVLVTIHRPKNPPTFFKEKVELWNGQQSDHAAKVVQINGRIQGEITADPPQLEWVLADFGPDITKYSEEALSRHITIISALGKPVDFKKVSTDVKGMSVKVVPTIPNRHFDLIVKFDQLPHNLVEGKVTLETSLESTPKIEVPLHISAAP